MSMNGKRDDFDVEDFVACGEKAMLRKARVLLILDEVTAAVRKWKKFAEQAGVPKDRAGKIEKTHRFFDKKRT